MVKNHKQLEIQGSLELIKNSQISLFSQKNGTGVKQKENPLLRKHGLTIKNVAMKQKKNKPKPTNPTLILKSAKQHI